MKRSLGRWRQKVAPVLKNYEPFVSLAPKSCENDETNLSVGKSIALETVAQVNVGVLVAKSLLNPSEHTLKFVSITIEQWSDAVRAGEPSTYCLVRAGTLSFLTSFTSVVKIWRLLEGLQKLPTETQDEIQKLSTDQVFSRNTEVLDLNRDEKR